MPVEISIQEGIITVTLNDPGRGNSFGLDSADALHEILRQHAPSKSKKAKTPDIRGLVLKAEGRLFCAGGNLDDYAGMKESIQGKKVNRRITAVLDELSLWPYPTVCAVTGDCYGGGVELISAFDKVLAVPEAMFGLWQRRIALTFGWGGGARLQRRLSDADLRRLALDAKSFSSYEALDLGLVDEVHLRARIGDRAIDWINRSKQLPGGPVAALKEFEPKKERRIFERLWWSDDHRKVLSKRAARRG